MEVKTCPSCHEKNNPSFSVCWKCGIDFSTGKILPHLSQKTEGVVRNDRPKRIDIIGVSGIILAILIIAGGFGGSFQVTGTLRSLLYIIVFVSFGVSLIISSACVIGLKKWARKSFISQMYLITGYGVWDVAMVFVSAVRHSHFWWTDFIGLSFIFLFIPLLSIYCLTLPKVKECFK